MLAETTTYETGAAAANPEGEGAASPLDRPLIVTTFPNQSASQKRERRMSLRALDREIRAAEADSKAGLPWFKLAAFGNDRTPLRPRRDGKGMTGGSLRSNANLLTVAGAEADYDGGEIGLAEAAERLHDGGISGLIYTTPSSTATAPRWRIFCPSSTELPPAERGRLVARLNGLFGGALDPSSFTASQAFYAGGVTGRLKIETALVEGRFLDLADDLDAGAIGRPGGVERETGEVSGEPTGLTKKQFADALNMVPNDSTFDHRRKWFGILNAIKHELGDTEEAFALADEWSEGHPSYDPDKTRADWDSIYQPHATGELVLHHARKKGWRDPRYLEVGHPMGFGDADVPPPGLDTEGMLLAGWCAGAPGETAALVARFTANLNATVAPLFTSASLLIGEPPPRRWLVDGLIPNATVTMLGGDGGTGKSLLALQLAVATATGTRWIGRDVEHPGTVMFLSAEDDRDELHRRLSDICRAAVVDMGDLDRLLIRSLAGEDALLAVLKRDGGNLRSTPLYKRLDAEMVKARPTLLVLDTLADLHAGNENDRTHARQFVGLLRHLALEHGCSVLLLAHPSLSGINSGSGLSGSTAWNASVRSRVYLDRVKVGEGAGAEEPDPNLRVLRTMKANYAATGGEITVRWEGGIFVADRPDADDCYLQGETAEERAERVFLKLLNRSTRRQQKVSPYRSPTFAPAIFAKDAEGEGLKKAVLEMAMRRLLDNGTLVIAEEGPESRRRHFLRRVSDD